MKRIPYYAILSGFVPGDIPGVGTFYDFFKRLWAAVDDSSRRQDFSSERELCWFPVAFWHFSLFSYRNAERLLYYIISSQAMEQ